MSCLSIIQDAAIDLHVAVPATIIGTTDATARKLLRLLNKELVVLARRHDWQALTKEHTFTSVAAVAQTAGIPDDFDRFIYNVEIWDRSRTLKFAGPTPSRVWQDLQTNLTGGIVGWWRRMGDGLLIFPAQPAGNTLAYEYITDERVYRSADDSHHATFSQDDDEPVGLPEDILTMGVVWRWGASTKGYDYSEEMADYERAVELATSRDRGTGVIYPPPTESSMPPVPTWPGTITVP